MSDYFIGEIRAFAFGSTYVPRGWVQCNGQLLSVQQNQALFALLSNQYGGDGRNTFGVPDLRARVVVGSGVSPSGNPYQQSKSGGLETVALTGPQMPAHNHAMVVSTASATKQGPGVAGDRLLATDTPANVPIWSPAATLTPLASNALLNTGGSAPHSNMQPFGVLNFCISTTGIWPSRQ